MVYDGKLYFGTSATGSVVNYMQFNNTFTISYKVNDSIYPSANYPNTWFTLSNGSGNVNICGGGYSTDSTTYHYNGGNSSYDTNTNIMSVTFFLPVNGITLTEQYGTSFTLQPGEFNIIPYCAPSNYSSINQMDSIPVTLGNVIVPPEVACFKEGSRILTSEGYVPVQNLRKGDLVKTFKNGFVAIHSIGKRKMQHLASEERIKDQLYKCSTDKYPELLEDLVITGCHSILVNKFTSDEQRENTIKINRQLYVTDGKYRLPACADEKASVYDKSGYYNIYHFALENDDYYMNYGVYANGLLVETCSKRYLNELSNMELL